MNFINKYKLNVVTSLEKIKDSNLLDGIRLLKKCDRIRVDYLS